MRNLIASTHLAWLGPLVALGGCALPAIKNSPARQSLNSPAARPDASLSPVQFAAHQISAPEKKDPAPELLPVTPLPVPSASPAAPFAGASELSVAALVEQVLAHNPSLPQMVAAWQAATTKYPQVTSLDDPLLGTALAPRAIKAPNMKGYRVEIFQRFPFPGKLRLRGEVALAEAEADGRNVEDMRQQLIESARDAFYEYYFVARATEVNDEILGLLRDSRKTAEGLYKTGKVKQQDLNLLDVELGRQRNRSVLLDRQRAVAVARMNTLLHLPPTSDLPPPPKVVRIDDELPDPKALRDKALAQRLDLLALTDRLRAVEASLQLALREYYPDFDVMAAYDAMWDQSEMRPQVAVRINLPVRLARRDAAVAEAEARIAELRAQLTRQQDQALFEVQQAYEQWRESLRTVRLFEKDVLPPAKLSVSSAKASYAVGEVSLLILLDAQRSLADLQDQYYQATAEYFRRRTVLERSLTGTPSTSPLPKSAERPRPGQPGSPTGMGRQ